MLGPPGITDFPDGDRQHIGYVVDFVLRLMAVSLRFVFHLTYISKYTFTPKLGSIAREILRANIRSAAEDQFVSQSIPFEVPSTAISVHATESAKAKQSVL